MRLITRHLETIEPCRDLWAGAASRNWVQSSLLIKDANLGIGTTGPGRKLEVKGSGTDGIRLQRASSAQDTELTFANEAATDKWFMHFDGSSPEDLFLYPAASGQDLILQVNEAGTTYGNVGIGTTAPTETLTVVGTANITSTLYKGTSAYNNPDIAEKMSSKEKLEFGDVVSADKENSLHVKKSASAFDTAVIGVVSEAPTMVIGNINGSSGTPIAVVGRVKAKVSNENGNIQIGDLLTTSNKEGYAMKCDSLDNCKSAVIGKALEQFSNEKGKIWMLLALQ